jgi:hypothetical protein
VPCRGEASEGILGRIFAWRWQLWERLLSDLVSRVLGEQFEIGRPQRVLPDLRMVKLWVSGCVGMSGEMKRAAHVGGFLVQSRQLATGEAWRWLSLSSWADSAR